MINILIIVYLYFLFEIWVFIDYIVLGLNISLYIYKIYKKNGLY